MIRRLYANMRLQRNNKRQLISGIREDIKYRDELAQFQQDLLGGTNTPDFSYDPRIVELFKTAHQMEEAPVRGMPGCPVIMDKLAILYTHKPAVVPRTTEDNSALLESYLALKLPQKNYERA